MRHRPTADITSTRNPINESIDPIPSNTTSRHNLLSDKNLKLTERTSQEDEEGKWVCFARRWCWRQGQAWASGTPMRRLDSSASVEQGQ
ncbi:hypothetical protein ACFX12_034353 [Malus domestica]